MRVALIREVNKIIKWKENFVKEIIWNGIIFWMDLNKKKFNQLSLSPTSESQKWKGTNPNFISIEVEMRILLSSINKKFLERIILQKKIILAIDWIIKYLNSLLTERLFFSKQKKINLRILISKEIQKKNQFVAEKLKIMEKISKKREEILIQFKKIYK